MNKHNQRQKKINNISTPTPTPPPPSRSIQENSNSGSPSMFDYIKQGFGFGLGNNISHRVMDSIFTENPKNESNHEV